MRKAEKFITNHLSFILTIVITYVLGSLFVVFQCLNNKEDILEKTIDSLVPITITYILGCVITNIISALQGKTSGYVYNLITCVCIFIYSIIFCIYIITTFSFFWVILELVLTFLMLSLNVLCYKENRKQKKHRII